MLSNHSRCGHIWHVAWRPLWNFFRINCITFSQGKGLDFSAIKKFARIQLLLHRLCLQIILLQSQAYIWTLQQNRLWTTDLYLCEDCNGRRRRRRGGRSGSRASSLWRRLRRSWFVSSPSPPPHQTSHRRRCFPTGHFLINLPLIWTERNFASFYSFCNFQVEKL